jgi:hypothetical protein
LNEKLNAFLQRRTIRNTYDETYIADLDCNLTDEDFTLNKLQVYSTKYSIPAISPPIEDIIVDIEAGIKNFPENIKN